MLASRLPLIIAISLCVLISGVFFWQLSPYILPLLGIETSFEASKQATQNISPNIRKPEKALHDYNIAGFKLFGDITKVEKKEIIQPETLPQTSLRLTLTGVLAGKDNVQASALIEGPDKQTRNYRIEEEVPGGAILKQVYADRVVLERSGQLENLIFEETRPIGIVTQKEEPDEDMDDEEDRPVMTHSSPQLDSFTQQQTQQIKDRLSKLRSRLQNSGP